MTIKLIGLTGKMGSGKSTAIKFITKWAGRNKRDIKPLKFAQPLYDMQEYIYDRISPVYTRPDDFVKDRKLLQWLGTEWGRDTIRKTLWGDIFAEAFTTWSKNEAVIVVSDDVRFDTEAELIHKLGGKIIQLTRSSGDDVTHGGASGHASEAGINQKFVDFVVDNNGSLEEYEMRLYETLERMKGNK